MIKTALRLIAAIASLALSALPSGHAHAALIAGWDFSQYFGPNTLSIDGSTFEDTLRANYSDLDPTQNLGAESQAFGEVFFDGSFGSTDVNEAASGAAFAPFSGSLTSNINAPSVNPFDSHSELDAEGQIFENFLSMTANSAVTVVFKADMTSVPTAGSGWTLSLGGQTISGTATIQVAFGVDGSTFIPVTTINLTDSDTAFTVNLGLAVSDLAFVRLTISAPQALGVNQAVIDNVAISATAVPAAPVAVLLLATLAGLNWSLRRRA